MPADRGPGDNRDEDRTDGRTDDMDVPADSGHSDAGTQEERNREDESPG